MNKYLIFENKAYFLVSVFSGEREEVLSKQNIIKANGGAGYIYVSNEKYFLLANIYDNFDDAKSVCENLNSYSPEIININLKKLVISNEYSTNQIKTLKYVLNQVNRAIETTSDIVAKFDHGEILEGEAKQKLQNFANSCQQDKEMLTEAFQSVNDNIVVCAKIFCSQTISNISATSLSSNFSSDAKKLMIEIVLNFCDFQKKIT